MKLSELILSVGDENILVEPISSNITGNITLKKGGFTQITLLTKGATPIDFVSGQGKMVGLLIWIPKDKWPD
jgi:hypothetical protein